MLGLSNGRARAFVVAAGSLGVGAAFVSALVTAAGAVSASACGSPSSAGGGDGGQNPAGPPIVLGASVGLTGANSGNATALKGGLVTAAQQVNALGGILGRQIVVKVIDDESDPTKTLKVAMQLVSDGASALIGPTTSSEVASLSSFIASGKLVEVSATATSTQLTATQPAGAGFFFRTVPSDAYQAVAVGIFALRGPNPDGGVNGCHTMDVVHNNDDYGNPLAMTLENYFKANGGVVPATGDFPVPSTAQGSYLTQVQQVLTHAPDCLVLAVYPPVAAQFMHNLSDQLATNKPAGWSKGFFVIGTDGTYQPSLITEGRASASDPSSQSWVNGTYGPPMYGTVALTNDATRPQYNELVGLYEAEVGLGAGKTDLDPYTSNQYDAAVLTLLAMQAAGTTTDGASIEKAMFNVSRGKGANASPFGPAELGDALTTLQGGGDINYQGASGDVDFDAQGDVIADFLIWQVQGNGFVSHDKISSTLLAGAQ